MGRLTDEQVAAWTVASCEAQGLPVAISDPTVVDQVAVLLTGRSGRRPPERAGALAGRSQPPDRADTVGVEDATSDGGRSDDGVVEHGFDDGALAAEVEVGPVAL